MTSLLLLLASSILVSPNQAKLPKYLEKIDAKDLRAHVTYLASDELEGRGTPSKGLNMAADYIAKEFKRMGLAPAVSGSYFQETLFGVGASAKEPVRNVIGFIKGSDPKLADTYVLITAHYDHLGKKDGIQEGDVIFNGADDDASGVAGVLESAEAIVAAKPRRSVVFITFWGEERGLLGSSYYAQHPVFPLAKTIADINLEQIGRTDDTEGPRVSEMSMTGFDFSDMGTIFAEVGKTWGVPITKHPKYSSPFFMASDNAALAAAGIPAHTLCTAFEFPDYHKVGDSADKLDYKNMEKVVRVAAEAMLKIANSDTEPKWNADLPRVKRYIEAQKKLKEGTAGSKQAK